VLSGAVVDIKVLYPFDAIVQNKAAMFPLPSKN
jgi:hypothetical protein